MLASSSSHAAVRLVARQTALAFPVARAAYSTSSSPSSSILASSTRTSLPASSLAATARAQQLHLRSVTPSSPGSLALRAAFSSCPPRRSEKEAASAKDGAEDQPSGDKAAAGAAATGGEDAHAVALKEKDAKIKELNDALLYARADMQNLMRRTAEDKANASDYAITKLARDLTSSLDILQIALRSVPESLRKAAASGQAAPESSSEEGDPRRALVDLYSGLELTERSLLDMLKSHGVTEFDPTGEKFDPALHEALYQAPVPGKTPGTVLECQKRGYKIKNRVLRAAQVGVVQSTD
ncbi:GrpE, mitochondrial [Tilletia horrida]|nr:GrpE, mitochondrial [Tilletia horrida]